MLIPAVVDGSLRLAGIGLPAGMIAGVLIYVTMDLLRPAAGANDRPGGARRQLLTLALFAAVVAHFFEVHMGIAIASTLTHFWIFSAVLVVNGMGWIREEEAPRRAAPAAARRTGS